MIIIYWAVKFSKIINSNGSLVPIDLKKFPNFKIKRWKDSDYYNALNQLAMDEVPHPNTLDDIWFYMNYRINFFRLLRENRPVKLEQGLKWMTVMCRKTMRIQGLHTEVSHQTP